MLARNTDTQRENSMTDYNKELISFLDKSPTAFHAVAILRRGLKLKGILSLQSLQNGSFQKAGSTSWSEMIRV